MNVFILNNESLPPFHESADLNGVRAFVLGGNMLISVIVPYRNSEKYIGRCVESLKTQNGDLEFVLVDDGSNDRSAEIVSEMTQDDMRFIRVTSEPRGVSSARNIGMRCAWGEWVTFLDSDDILLSDAYEKFTKAIERDPQAKVHQFNHVRFSKKARMVGFKYINSEGRYTMPNPPEAWFGVWNKLFRADFIKDIWFDESLQYGEDGLFVLECYAKGIYIHHADERTTVVEHIIENQNSLSHIKTPHDILHQVHAYVDFLDRQTDPDLRSFMCDEISRLVTFPRLKRFITYG